MLLSSVPCRQGERKGGLNQKCKGIGKALVGMLKVGRDSAGIPYPPGGVVRFLEELADGGWLVDPGRGSCTSASDGLPGILPTLFCATSWPLLQRRGFLLLLKKRISFPG